MLELFVNEKQAAPAGIAGALAGGTIGGLFGTAVESKKKDKSLLNRGIATAGYTAVGAAAGVGLEALFRKYLEEAPAVVEELTATQKMPLYRGMTGLMY